MPFCKLLVSLPCVEAQHALTGIRPLSASLLVCFSTLRLIFASLLPYRRRLPPHFPAPHLDRRIVHTTLV